MVGPALIALPRVWRRDLSHLSQRLHIYLLRADIIYAMIIYASEFT